MSRRVAAALGVAAVFALSAQALAGQSVLTGTVRADSTGRPLAGVEVVVSGSDRRALTDNAGRYVLNMLPAGRRMVLFRSVGFRPVQEWVVLGAADTVWANPMLIPETVRLDPLVVTARPDAPRGIGVEAFEERRRLGFGKFLDSTELRRNDHLPLVEMLGRLQGIGFARVPGETNSIAAVSQRRFTPDGGVCYMSVIVDGVVLYSSVAPGLAGPDHTHNRPPPDLRMYSVANIEAVELYRGASEVPMEYGGTGAACGVVILWTRRN